MGPTRPGPRGPAPCGPRAARRRDVDAAPTSQTRGIEHLEPGLGLGQRHEHAVADDDVAIAEQQLAHAVHHRRPGVQRLLGTQHQDVELRARGRRQPDGRRGGAEPQHPVAVVGGHGQLRRQPGLRLDHEHGDRPGRGEDRQRAHGRPPQEHPVHLQLDRQPPDRPDGDGHGFGREHHHPGPRARRRTGRPAGRPAARRPGGCSRRRTRHARRSAGTSAAAPAGRALCWSGRWCSSRPAGRRTRRRSCAGRGAGGSFAHPEIGADGRVEVVVPAGQGRSGSRWRATPAARRARRVPPASVHVVALPGGAAAQLDISESGDVETGRNRAAVVGRGHAAGQLAGHRRQVGVLRPGDAGPGRAGQVLADARVVPAVGEGSASGTYSSQASSASTEKPSE